LLGQDPKSWCIKHVSNRRAERWPKILWFLLCSNEIPSLKVLKLYSI
jgi:hypothetical protein